MQEQNKKFQCHAKEETTLYVIDTFTAFIPQNYAIIFNKIDI